MIRKQQVVDVKENAWKMFRNNFLVKWYCRVDRLTQLNISQCVSRVNAEAKQNKIYVPLNSAYLKLNIITKVTLCRKLYHRLIGPLAPLKTFPWFRST